MVLPGSVLPERLGKGVECKTKRFKMSSEHEDKSSSQQLPLIYITVV